jgi:hypothetical protein
MSTILVVWRRNTIHIEEFATGYNGIAATTQKLPSYVKS